MVQIRRGLDSSEDLADSEALIAEVVGDQIYLLGKRRRSSEWLERSD